ncbi:MAG TPA: DUF4136 domain-containing protein [Croceibacterium sp.]|nr:DUF4136 domain-containing protein [Croceibacterium sp.]
MITFSQLGRGVKLALVPLALAGLAACASPFRADVQRFESQLPVPNGQTFTVVADDPALAGGIEFRHYAQLVADNLAALGYTPVNNPSDAQLLVRFDYGVDNGRERVRSTGFGYRDPFYSSWYGYQPVLVRTPYGTRIAYARGFSPWGWGWNDSFFGGGSDVYSYTVYTSGIEMKIDRAGDGQRLFEGKAQAASTSNRLQYLVPNLVEAMFTGFPGNSGETVRISVAPENQRASR